MMASDWRSAWKRRTTDSSYMPALMSFSATESGALAMRLFRQPDLAHSAFSEFANQMKAFGKNLSGAWHTCRVADSAVSEKSSDSGGDCRKAEPTSSSSERRTAISSRNA